MQRPGGNEENADEVRLDGAQMTPRVVTVGVCRDVGGGARRGLQRTIAAR